MTESLTIVGARPQFIKAAPVSRALAAVIRSAVGTTGGDGRPYSDGRASQQIASAIAKASAQEPS